MSTTMQQSNEIKVNSVHRFVTRTASASVTSNADVVDKVSDAYRMPGTEARIAMRNIAERDAASSEVKTG